MTGGRKQSERLRSKRAVDYSEQQRSLASCKASASSSQHPAAHLPPPVPDGDMPPMMATVPVKEAMGADGQQPADMMPRVLQHVLRYGIVKVRIPQLEQLSGAMRAHKDDIIKVRGFINLIL